MKSEIYLYKSVKLGQMLKYLSLHIAIVVTKRFAHLVDINEFREMGITS